MTIARVERIAAVKQELDQLSAGFAAHIKKHGGEAFASGSKVSLDLEAIKRRIDAIKEKVDALAQETEAGVELVAKLDKEPPKEAAKEPLQKPDAEVTEVNFLF